MTENRSQAHSMGELEIIEMILSRLPLQKNLIVPPGDDSAVVHLDNCPMELVLTSDPVIEGTHFSPGTDPASIGHKAAGRVLSDLAAMGAEPKWILLNIAAPETAAIADIAAISESAAALCAQFGAAVAGGDIASSPIISVNAFACGIIPAGSSVTRSGARPGDAVFVTDSLGGSIYGKHLSFTPRVKEGLWLRKHGYPSAMIDITDGLASDLRHILRKSSAGALLDLKAVPVSTVLQSLPPDMRIKHALSDGEDFELLFTVPQSRIKDLISQWQMELSTPISMIGSITSDYDKILYENGSGGYNILTLRGYQHFEDNSTLNNLS